MFLSPGDERRIEHSEEARPATTVRDVRTHELRTIFIQLVGRDGAINTDGIDSYTAEDCFVDFDEDGKVIGVSVTFFKEVD